MNESNWLDTIVIAIGVIVYLVSVVMAAAQYESRVTGQQARIKGIFWKGLPYALSVALAAYYSGPWKGTSFLEVFLFAGTFVVLTWVIVWSVRKQKAGG